MSDVVVATRYHRWSGTDVRRPCGKEHNYTVVPGYRPMCPWVDMSRGTGT